MMKSVFLKIQNREFELIGFNSSTLCLIPLSGVNLKVQIPTSGPSRINVLPPRKGTIHLHSNIYWLCTVKQQVCSHIYSNESVCSLVLLLFRYIAGRKEC